MADLSQPDEVRIEKLRRWLESLSVDVVQVGHELTMPSPFKEREKRKTDDKRRLSVTVVQEAGIPTLRWQCWWSKGKTGKPFGGRSAYALSVLTKKTQKEISDLLELRYDEKVEQAETAIDKVSAILTQPARELEARRTFRAQQQTQTLAATPHLMPSSILSLWDGNPLTKGPEGMVEERGITKPIGYDYGLGWDYDEQAIWLPWVDRKRTLRIYQRWDGAKYRFPRDEPGRMTKSDAIFGLHTWKVGRPLVINEGAFTAMSVCGVALGGSTMSDVQLSLIADCKADLIIPAFDNDHGGFDGSLAISKRLQYELGCKVAPVFCPEGNDWNVFIKKNGFQKTMQTFAERVQNSLSMSLSSAIATQYRGGR